MAFASHEQPKRVYPKPEVLRLNVAEQLARLPDAGVVVLHDLAQELELRAAWADFSDGIAEDWAAGKYENLQASLIAARQAIQASRE